MIDENNGQMWLRTCTKSRKIIKGLGDVTDLIALCQAIAPLETVLRGYELNAIANVLRRSVGDIEAALQDMSALMHAPEVED